MTLIKYDKIKYYKKCAMSVITEHVLISSIINVSYSDGTMPNFSFRSDSIRCIAKKSQFDSIDVPTEMMTATLCNHYTTRVSW